MLPPPDAFGINWLCHVLVRRRADHFFPRVFVESQHVFVPGESQEVKDAARLRFQIGNDVLVVVKKFRQILGVSTSPA
jgi:hypothetical protein